MVFRAEIQCKVYNSLLYDFLRMNFLCFSNKRIYQTSKRKNKPKQNKQNINRTERTRESAASAADFGQGFRPIVPPLFFCLLFGCPLQCFSSSRWQNHR